MDALSLLQSDFYFALQAIIAPSTKDAEAPTSQAHCCSTLMLFAQDL